jgi:tRNA(fMet)-specific endonuclease VapC
MRYLLDTTVVSDFTRGVPAVLARLKAVSKGHTAICTVTAMEIEYGLMLNPARHPQDRADDSRLARRPADIFL